jgi:RHS repeat-associated protein
MFTFSAKEKDSETGLSYFGARYYSSDLSIWLSVDPQASKYPSLSPYTYCANNPIKLVDPNGEDIWTIDENGKISCEKNKNIDRIDVVDKDGNKIEGTAVKYGTIKRHTTKYKSTKIDYFEINDDAVATETFENIADNTNMEWTHAKIGKEGSNRNIVGTSHSINSTAVGDFLLKTNYTLREVNHNHPSGFAWPSGSEYGSIEGDCPHAKEYQEKFPDIKLNIYVNGHRPEASQYELYQKGYHQYNKYGPVLRQSN